MSIDQKSVEMPIEQKLMKEMPIKQISIEHLTIEQMFIVQATDVNRTKVIVPTQCFKCVFFSLSLSFATKD
jgi:hypothetical protein